MGSEMCIRDRVWIDDHIEYERVKRIQKSLDDFSSREEHGCITKIRITVVNYKRKPLKFDLYAVKPSEAIVGFVNPKPVKITDKYIKWSLPTIQPTEKLEIYFELAGLKEGDFDENELYVEGIKPEYVIGANKWEGE